MESEYYPSQLIPSELVLIYPVSILGPSQS
jgi:hypothetical protein